MFKSKLKKNILFFLLTYLLFNGSLKLYAVNLIGNHTIIGIDHYPIHNKWLNLIKKYDVSGVVFVSNNYANPEYVKKSIQKIQQLNPKKTYLFCVDQEGGRVNRIKFNSFRLNSAQYFVDKDDYYVAQQYFKNSQLLASVGINVNFAPVADVNRQTNNKVIGSRSYSNDPFKVQKYAQIMIDQQVKFNILSVIKHFPGHGQTSVDSHFKLPIHSDESSFEAYDMYPFYKLIKNGAQAVMVSHVMYPNIDSTYPASLSSKLISKILIQELKFNGLVFSDDINMGAIKNSYGLKDAWIKSVSAGVDQVIMIASYEKVISVFEQLDKMIYQNKKLYDILLTNSNQVLSFKQNHLN